MVIRSVQRPFLGPLLGRVNSLVEADAMHLLEDLMPLNLCPDVAGFAWTDGRFANAQLQIGSSPIQHP